MEKKLARVRIRYIKRPQIYILTAAVIVVCLIVLGYIVWCKTSVFLTRSWRTNVVLKSDPPVIVSLPKNREDKIILLSLPADTYTKVPYGYGEYQLLAVWRLGELEKKPRLYLDTLEDALALKLAGWVGEGALKPVAGGDDFVASIKATLTPIKVVLGQVGGNLSFPDQLFLAYKHATAGAGNFDLAETQNIPLVFQTQELPDGTQVKEINDSVADKYLSPKFEETEVRRESLSVEVRNTTQIPGLGQKFARFISQIGGKVVTVGNESDKISGCRLHLRVDMLKNTLVKYLQREFDCQPDTIGYQGNGELDIYLGPPFGHRWEVKNN